MAASEISKALVVSLQDTDKDVLRKWKGNLEELLNSDPVELYLLRDVKDLFKRLKKLEGKLKKTLEKTKVVVIFTSPKLSTIKDESGLQKALKELPDLDESSAKLLGKYVKTECKSGGKLLLVSLDEELSTSDFFKDVTHLSGMTTGNNEDIARWIAGKCR